MEMIGCSKSDGATKVFVVGSQNELMTALPLGTVRSSHGSTRSRLRGRRDVRLRRVSAFSGRNGYRPKVRSMTVTMSSRLTMLIANKFGQTVGADRVSRGVRDATTESKDS